MGTGGLHIACNRWATRDTETRKRPCTSAVSMSHVAHCPISRARDWRRAFSVAACNVQRATCGCRGPYKYHNVELELEERKSRNVPQLQYCTTLPWFQNIRMRQAYRREGESSLLLYYSSAISAGVLVSTIKSLHIKAASEGILQWQSAYDSRNYWKELQALLYRMR